MERGQGLTSGQMTMLALGSAIGGAFFLGSAVAIRSAGPAVLLGFAVGGLVVYVVLMVLAIVTSLLALVPVSLHRSVFRQQVKPELVTASHHIMRLVLAGIALLMTGTILFVLDWAVSRWMGVVAGGLVFVGVVVVAVLPGRLWPRGRRSAQAEDRARNQEVDDQA